MNMEKSVRVIVAEDDFLVGKEIARALHILGHTIVAEVANGKQAVDKTCELKPDVILMDVQMPEMDGLKASELIQQQCPTPIVVLTAHESKDLVEKASDTGVGAYLTKPPKTSEIERAIVISMARHDDLMLCKRLNNKLSERTRELENALSEIKTLRGILPICSSCKKIRDDNGYWNQLETYIRAHSSAEFSHSICPECARELYPELKIASSKETERNTS